MLDLAGEVDRAGVGACMNMHAQKSLVWVCVCVCVCRSIDTLQNWRMTNDPGYQANLSQSQLEGSEGSAFLSLVRDVSYNCWKVFRLTLETISDGKAPLREDPSMSKKKKVNEFVINLLILILFLAIYKRLINKKISELCKKSSVKCWCMWSQT